MRVAEDDWRVPRRCEVASFGHRQAALAWRVARPLMDWPMLVPNWFAPFRSRRGDTLRFLDTGAILRSPPTRAWSRPPPVSRSLPRLMARVVFLSRALCCVGEAGIDTTDAPA